MKSLWFIGFFGLVPQGRLLAQQSFPNRTAPKNHESISPSSPENAAMGLPALPPVLTGPKVFPIIQDPNPGPNGSTIYYQASSKGVVTIEVPAGETFSDRVAIEVTPTGEAYGFRPSAANAAALAQSQNNLQGSFQAELEKKAGAVDNAKRDSKVSYPVQAPKQPTKGQMVSPLVLKVGNLLEASEPREQSSSTTIPSSEQNAKADAYYDEARSSLGVASGSGNFASHSLVKSASPDLAEVLKDVMGSMVKYDAKGAGAQDYQAGLNRLLENSKFQSYAAKQLGPDTVNDFNQAVVAGNRVLAKPDAKDWAAVDAAFRMATAKPAPGAAPPELADTSEDGVSVSGAPTLVNTSGATSPAIEPGKLAASGAINGNAIPLDAEEWIRYARFLASEASLTQLKNSDEKQRRRAGLLALERWINELRQFEGLDLLAQLEYPAKHNPADAQATLLRVRKILRATRDLVERGSPRTQTRIRALRENAKKTLAELDASPGIPEALKVLEQAVAGAQIRRDWNAYDRVLYQEFRRSIAELIFEVAEQTIAQDSNSPLTHLVSRSFAGRADQRERAKRKRMIDADALRARKARKLEP